MRSRIRVIIVFLVVLNVGALLYLRGSRQRAAVQRQRAADLSIVAGSMEKSGSMSRDEYYHLQEIDQKAVMAGKLSDDDLDWCLNLLNLRGSADTPHGSYVRSHVVNVLRHDTTYTPSQKDKVYHQVIERTFTLRDPSAVYDRIGVAKLVRVTKDKRAVPCLLTMLNEKQNSLAVKFGREALDSLGYTP